MFGEPGDGFHDAYVEANYAYRAALKVSPRSLQFPHFPKHTHTHNSPPVCTLVLLFKPPVLSCHGAQRAGV